MKISEHAMNAAAYLHEEVSSLGGFQKKIQHAIDSATTERDIEWWSKLCMVDAIALEPAAVRAWVIAEHELMTEQATKKLKDDNDRLNGLFNGALTTIGNVTEENEQLRERIKSMEGFLNTMIHTREYSASDDAFVCRVDCPRCAWERMKKEGK